MAKKLDYKQIAADIVRLVGGPENVSSLGHCMTRLRFILKDESKVDAEAIKKVPAVLGTVSAGGQFMVIMGQNLLPVYEAAQKDFNFSAGSATNENLDAGTKEKQPLTPASAAMAVLGYISASVTPMVTGLVAGGMLKVVLLLITLIPGMENFSSTSTYLILSGVADAAFFFMPILVAYGAATKLGGTPIYSMIVAAALLHGNYTALVAAGEAVTLIGLPVRLVNYATSLLPALLIAVAAYYAEKFFNKIIPGIFKSLLVGLGTITVTSILTFVILAPIGSLLGSYLAVAFMFLGDTVGFIAVGALAAALPWLVVCGMHTALAPFMAQALSNPGYDSLIRPAFILHNMAEGGACIGVALRCKDLEKRSEALGIAFGCVMAGVTEPAIYGINLPRKKPMIGVMAGGALGGIVASVLGARAYVMGYSTVLALPIFQDTIIAMSIAIVVAIVAATVVTFVLYSGEDQETASAPQPKAPELAVPTITCKTGTVYAPVQGIAVPNEEIPDETFATGILGRGVGIQPEIGLVVAPFDGEIISTTATKHAVGVLSPDGIEILIHVGVDTVAMNGEGFTCFVTEGQKVKAGDKLIVFDKAKIAAAGHPDVVAVLVTNSDDYANLSIKTGSCKVLDSIITV